jgi:sulfite reductase (NADPH) hemoprotein beta-component
MYLKVFKNKMHLAKYNLDNLAFSGLRKVAMACIVPPICSLAMAKSEHHIPKPLTLVEETTEKSGLTYYSVVFKTTYYPFFC